MNNIAITPIFVKHPFKIFDLNSYLSLIIRIVTRFKYNHCAIKYTENGIVYIVESRSSGIFKSTYKNWLKHRPDKIWIEDKIIRINVEEINIRLGNKYDIPSLFYQLFYQLFDIWIGDKSDTQENCAEFLADLLKIKQAYLQTPKSIYYYLKLYNSK